MCKEPSGHKRLNAFGYAFAGVSRHDAAMSEY